MEIIIDTNIIRNDFLLKSQNIGILLDYLKKTDSRILLPQVVFEEISGLYLRVLSEKYDKYKGTINTLSSLLVNIENKLPTFDLDLNEESKSYLKFLKKTFKLTDNHIIPYQQTYLNEIIKRAIKRQKPLGPDGQNFRDGIIWLTILDYAKKNSESEIAFISDNRADFSNESNTGFHPDLEKEAKTLDLKITYYTSLKDFIKAHSEKISFITEEWLNKYIEHNDISSTVLSHLNRDYYNSKFLRWFEHAIDGEKTLTGNYNITMITALDTYDYLVYEKSDGDIIVSLTLTGEIEVEFEYEEEEENDPTYSYRTSYSTDSIARTMHSYRTTKWATKYPPITVYMTLFIVDNQVDNSDIDEIDLE